MALEDNLIAFYTFDNSDSTDDFSTHDGTDTNISYGAGKIGNCAYNLSKTGKIALGSFELPAAFSVGGWVKMDSIDDVMTFFSTYNGGGTGSAVAQCFLSLTTGELGYSNYNVDIGWSTTKISADGNWHHVMWTHNGTTAYVYLDGVMVKSGNCAHATTTAVANLMSRGDNVDEMDGYIDAVGIWGRKLSEQEVLALYKKGSGRQYPFNAVVVALTADTFIKSQTPDTNLGSDTSWVVQGDTNQTYRALLRASLPVGSGTISKVTLYAYFLNGGTNSQSGNIEAHTLTQTGWTEGGVTYNKYDGTNNWSSAGGDFSATIIHKIANPSGAGWKTWDLMGGSADNPLTLNWGDVVNILLKYQTEGTATSPDDYSVFYSREYTTDTGKQPFVVVEYTETTTSSSTTSSTTTTSSSTSSSTSTTTTSSSSSTTTTSSSTTTTTTSSSTSTTTTSSSSSTTTTSSSTTTTSSSTSSSTTTTSSSTTTTSSSTSSTTSSSTSTTTTSSSTTTTTTSSSTSTTTTSSSTSSTSTTTTSSSTSTTTTSSSTSSTTSSSTSSTTTITNVPSGLVLSTEEEYPKLPEQQY